VPPVRSLIARTIVTTLLAFPALAQTTTQTGTGKGGSPHVRTEWKIDGASVSIAYGRPSLKGRPEAQMMPIDKPWRTGADEATVLTTDKPLKFGALALAPGSYTINTQPGAKEWQLIIGKVEKAGQWGVPYMPALEIGRAPMKIAKAGAPAEQVTYAIDPNKGGGVMRIEWGATSVSAPFTVGK
jgi:hypothetical protein